MSVPVLSLWSTISLQVEFDSLFTRDALMNNVNYQTKLIRHLSSIQLDFSLFDSLVIDGPIGHGLHFYAWHITRSRVYLEY